jgi:hypothetical protein
LLPRLQVSGAKGTKGTCCNIGQRRQRDVLKEKMILFGNKKSDLISLEFRLGLFGFGSFFFQLEWDDQLVVDDQKASLQLDEKRPETETVDRKP